jgi:AcrR family transcriptional regulator
VVPLQEVLVKKHSKKERGADERLDKSVRARILRAAMQTFMERGYAESSTLAIATRAKVSKRELYVVFGSKEAMLAACITERAERMRLPREAPAARTREELSKLLVQLGALSLREICQPAVLAVFRLAISEATRSPEVARTLDTAGRQASRSGLEGVLAQAQTAGLIETGNMGEMSGEFMGLLWGDLMLSLLLRVREAPSARDIDRRAENATAAWLRLHGRPATI